MSKKHALNFTVSQQNEDLGMFSPNKKQRPVRDPASHRIIEKRRRDRMNNCLADLSQLIPSPYIKQGQGRIEKTEIIEMAIKHIQQLQGRLAALGQDTPRTCCVDKFCQGYEECRDNIMRYLMETLGFQPTESQNMYTYLEVQLEKRKPTLPAICVCGNNKAVPPPTSTLTLMDVLLPQSDDQSAALSTAGPHSLPATAVTAHGAIILCTPEPRGHSLPAWDSKSLSTSHSSATTGSSTSSKPPSRAMNASASASLETRPRLSHSESRYSVLESPAISDMSIVPMVGGELYSTVRAHDTQCDSGIQSSLSTDSQARPERHDSAGLEARNAGYKFKNDIKWRFSSTSEKGKEGAMDVGQDVEKEEFKDPLPPHSNSVYSADSVSDGNGSNGSSGNNGDHSSISTGGYSSNGNSSNSSIETSINNTVPAFALHPMGVYYIPLVLPVSQVMPFMKNHRSMGICHPVSIAVSFTGPFHMGILQVNSGLSGLGSDYSGENPITTGSGSRHYHHHHHHHRSSHLKPTRRLHFDDRGGDKSRGRGTESVQ